MKGGRIEVNFETGADRDFEEILLVALADVRQVFVVTSIPFCICAQFVTCMFPRLLETSLDRRCPS